MAARPTSWLTPLVVLAALAPLASSPASAQNRKRVKGRFERLETEATHFVLVCEGKQYVLSTKLMARYRSYFKELQQKPGTSITFEHDGKSPPKVTSIVLKKAALGRRRAQDGIYSHKDLKQRRLYFTDGSSWTWNQKKLSRSALTRLMTLRQKGVRVRVILENEQIVDIAKRTRSSKISAKILEIVKFSRKGDVIKIRFKGQPRHQVFKVVSRGARSIKVRFRPPGKDTWIGRQSIDLVKLDDLVNPAAEVRIRQNNLKKPGQEGTRTDAFLKSDARVGDMIGVNLDVGQLVALSEKSYELRLWQNGVWAPPTGSRPRNRVKSVSFVKLTNRQNISLAGKGNLEVRVERSRQSSTSALKFKVVLKHDAEDTILISVQLRFLLSATPCMDPKAQPHRIETMKVALPMFAGQRHEVTWTVTDERFVDGRVQVPISELHNLVPTTSAAARQHLVRVMEKSTDPAALAGVYALAAKNGDAELCNVLISRAALTQDPEHRELLWQTLKSHKFKALAPRLILEEVYLPMRAVERYTLVGGKIRRRKLPGKVKPKEFKQAMISLLGQLPDGLLAKSGKRTLFDLYLQRPDAMGGMIQQAYRQNGIQAVQALLAIAVDVRGGGPTKIQRAEQATALMKKLHKVVAQPMFKELRRRGIDTSALESSYKGTNRPEDVIKSAIYALVNREYEFITKKLSEEVDRAIELHGENKLDEALKVVNGVLEKDGDHEKAKELLPQLYIDKAKALSAAKSYGLAAYYYEEAFSRLKGAKQARAASPLAELLVRGVAEEIDAVLVKDYPHTGGAKLAEAAGKTFRGVLSKQSREWVEVFLDKKGKKRGYVRKASLRQTKGKDESGDDPNSTWASAGAPTPFNLLKEQIDRAKELSGAVEAAANEAWGRLSAREAELRYNQGDYQGALPHFDVAAQYAPTDPRLSLKTRCWIKANTTALASVFGVVLLAIGIALMQVFSRPKKIKFEGDFRHYGADRSAHERDLDVGE